MPTIEPKITEEAREFLSWADQFRKLKVRANADTPEDAKKALEFGAEGIGLCRTEHMFFNKDRLPAVQEMFMAEDKIGREKILNKLRLMQKEDFKQIFFVMKGCPVTIRLLDAPLHEFLPNYEKLLEESIEVVEWG
jgi:pyruvate,orthophosphate dikinase